MESHEIVGLTPIPWGRPVAIGQRDDIYESQLDIGTEKGKFVAVRVFRLSNNSRAAQEELLQSMRHEARVWRPLSHRNVVPFLGIYHDAPHPPAMVTPFYGNGNVRDYVKRNPGTDKLNLLVDVAEGLTYLHSRRVVHGDIRVSNVLVDDDGRAVISDVGLVALWTISNFTTTSVAGPARWQAPEVFTNEEEDILPFTFKSDVFSFSMFGVELLTGEPPFAQRKIDTVVIIDIIEGRRPIKPVDSKLADLLWPLFQECWDQLPDQRPTMSVVRDRLHLLH